MKYDLLLELVNKLNDYEDQASGKLSLNDFSIWLRSEIHEEKEKRVKLQDYKIEKGFDKAYNREVQISTLVAEMYRYAKGYSKKAMSDTPLKTLEEFGFLAHLMRDLEPTKSELINEQMLELTSGIEIIKRLNKLGLIAEKENKEDKRSKRVYITKKGRMLMFHVFEQMHKAAHVVSGELNTDEKDELIRLLSKLQHFHQEVYDKDKSSELEDILDKYLSES